MSILQTVWSVLCKLKKKNLPPHPPIPLGGGLHRSLNASIVNDISMPFLVSLDTLLSLGCTYGLLSVSQWTDSSVRLLAVTKILHLHWLEMEFCISTFDCLWCRNLYFNLVNTFRRQIKLRHANWMSGVLHFFRYSFPPPDICKPPLSITNTIFLNFIFRIIV